MATKLEEGGGLGKALVAGPLKKISFFAASLIKMVKYEVSEIICHYISYLFILLKRPSLNP